jgi:glycosyltransferase involved in cell wall biosynthesis
MIKLNQPLFSILIPTYNRALYIDDALRSALEQSYNNFEIIVCDDGSTDNTREIVLMFEDERIHYIKEEHSGAPHTRNRCISASRAEYLVWLDSDDILLPHTLEAYADIINKIPEVDILYGDLIVIDKNQKEIKTIEFQNWYMRNKELPLAMFTHNPIPNPGSMVRKSLYNNFGGYDESFLRAHDYEWWSRVAQTAVFKHVGVTVTKWRWHDTNMSSGTVKIDTSYDLKIVNTLLKKHTLEELFPDFKWKRKLLCEVESKAYLKIADRLLQLGDLDGALGYAKKSYTTDPKNKAHELATRPKKIESIKSQVKTFHGRNNRNSIRVLFVVHGFPPDTIGGTQLYVHGLAKELKARGHKVNVIYPIRDSSLPMYSITEGKYNDIDISQMNVSANFSCEDAFHVSKSLKNDRVADVFATYLAKLKPDIVHYHHFIGFTPAIHEACQRFGVKTIMTLHDGWFVCEQNHFVLPDGSLCLEAHEDVTKCMECYVGRKAHLQDELKLRLVRNAFELRKELLEQLYTNIDVVISPSRFLANAFSDFGFHHNHMQIIQLGLPSFRVLSWKPTKKAIRFTYLGHITRAKGLDILVNAFNTINHNKAKLDIYGVIADRTYYTDTMNRLSRVHKVKYHGPYTNDQLGEILAKTDVVVMPSRSENYPFVIRESLYANVPVIASNVGGISEISSQSVIMRTWQKNYPCLSMTSIN